MRYDTKIEKLIVPRSGGPDLEFLIEVIADFNRAIDDMFAELQARGEQDLLTELSPYFGTVWDAARALVHVLAAGPAPDIANKRFLEIGCGLAIPSMALLKLGAASVTATDMHPDVPAFLHRNLRVNGLEGHAGFHYRAVDWRDDPSTILGAERAPFDCVVASDVLYDRGQAEAVASFLKECSTRGVSRAIVTDPGRPYLQDFVSACKELGMEVTVEIFRVDPADSKRDVFVLWVR